MKDGAVEDSVQSRDPTNPSSDLSIKQKIISKIGALKNRQAYWTRRLDESVPSKIIYNAQWFLMLGCASHPSDFRGKIFVPSGSMLGSKRISPKPHE